MTTIDPLTQNHPLLILLDLCHRARAAAGVEELAFLVVNDTKLLSSYRQAALCFEGSGIKALSGVLQPEANAPYAQWLVRLQKFLLSTVESGQARRLVASELPDDLAKEWSDWFPAYALWLPLEADARYKGSERGGILLAGDKLWGDDEVAILMEWVDAWKHAWLAYFRPPVWSPKRWWEQIKNGLRNTSERKWWQRRSIQITLAFVVVLFFPVRLTVLAPGELVPASPAVIRAPLDGVIGQFHVQPNDVVKAGQILFSFDEAPIASRLEVARQSLATAETEYRQLAQMALSDPKSKPQIAMLLGKIGERRAEAEFLEGQFQRSRVLAPQDGVAIFDEPSEWIGKPVQTGERVMRVAQPHEVEIEAWVGIGDAIPLEQGATVSLYLAASPFSAVTGKLRYLNHDALPRPDGSYAYRVRASLISETSHRVGLKGTAKLHGDRVPFVYWVLRRPIASIRQFLAI